MAKLVALNDVLDALDELSNQASYSELAAWALAAGLEVSSLQAALNKCIEAGRS